MDLAMIPFIEQAAGILLALIIAVSGPAVIWHAWVTDRDARARKGRP